MYNEKYIQNFEELKEINKQKFPENLEYCEKCETAYHKK